MERDSKEMSNPIRRLPRVRSSRSKGPLTNDVFPVIWLHKLSAEAIQSLLHAVLPNRSTFKFRLRICDRTRSLLETN